MDTINFNQEWEFITAETHNEKSQKTNFIKREILFNLQILLSKIGMTTEASRDNFLGENYLALKKIYCTKNTKPRYYTALNPLF